MRHLPYALLAVAVLLQGCAAPVVAASVSAERMSAADRRVSSAIAEDGAIEAASVKRIAEKHKDGIRVNVAAFNGFVLLTGEVRNETARMDIERIVGSVPNVKGIANELEAGGGKAASAGNDAAITSSVKARLAGNPAFRADHVKVVTESGVVFLMGLLTHAEADAASEIVSTTRGVQRVVRVFEYID